MASSKMRSYSGRNVVAYSNLGIGRLIYQLPMPLCKMFIREIFDRDKILCLARKKAAHRLKCIRVLLILRFNNKDHTAHIGFYMQFFWERRLRQRLGMRRSMSRRCWHLWIHRRTARCWPHSVHIVKFNTFSAKSKRIFPKFTHFSKKGIKTLF